MNLFGFHTARYHSEYSLPFTIFVKKFYKKLYLLNFSTPSQVSTDTNFILLMSVIPHLLRDMLMTISSLLKMVGMTGFEPAAPTSRTWCATKLRYIPKTFFVKKFYKKTVTFWFWGTYSVFKRHDIILNIRYFLLFLKKGALPTSHKRYSIVCSAECYIPKTFRKSVSV